MYRPDGYLERSPDIRTLETATLTVEHLQNNSDTHKSAFSAIAELVDNAYDAEAKKCSIEMETEDLRERLIIQDDGKGMSREDALNVIKFGFSEKVGLDIGRYGNGLKTGSFHLGRDLLLLTKKDGVHTALMISRTLLDAADTNAQSTVYVPCPSTLLGDVYGDHPERFMDELSLIYKYGPLNLDENLDDYFNRIEDHGTILIIGKLLRKEAKGTYLKKIEHDHDLQVSAEEEDVTRVRPLCETSLREYLKILYREPKMKIVLCGLPVERQHVVGSWMGRCSMETRFKKPTDGFNMTLEKYKRDLAQMEERKNHLDSEHTYKTNSDIDVSNKGILHRSDDNVSQLTTNIHWQKVMIAKEQRDFKQKSFRLVMGLDVNNRDHNGIHFYINNRLVLWGHKTKFLKSCPTARGISAYCNLEFDLFRPTQTKQGFQSDKDFKWLVKEAEVHLKKYHEYLEKKWIPKHLYNTYTCKVTAGGCVWDTFWKEYSKLPTREESPMDKRLKAIEKDCGVWKYCGLCKSWRRFDSTPNSRGTGPDFYCTDVHDPENDSYLACGERVFNNEVCRDLSRIHFEKEKPAKFTIPKLEPHRPSSSAFARPSFSQAPLDDEVEDFESVDGDSNTVDQNLDEEEIVDEMADEDEDDRRRMKPPVENRRRPGEPESSEPRKKSRTEPSSSRPSLSTPSSSRSSQGSSQRSERHRLPGIKNSGRLERAFKWINGVLVKAGKKSVRPNEPLPPSDSLFLKQEKMERELEEYKLLVEEMCKLNLSLEVGNNKHFKLKIDHKLTPIEKLRKIVRGEAPRLMSLGKK